MYARVVQDNIGSRRVLEKNGFRIAGKDWFFSRMRDQDVKELVLHLDRPREPD